MASKTDKKLINPDQGLKLDTAGMPVSKEPVEGGVAMVNCSVPEGHEARELFRELSPDEKKSYKKTTKENVSFRKADARVFLRMKRDELIAATDFLPSSGRVKRKTAWLSWRKELFDLPDQIEDPEDVTWPEPPEAISVLLPNRNLWPDLDWGKFLG